MAQIIEQNNEQEFQWNSINWKQVESTVRHMQGRIYRATKEQQWMKVRNLQKLLAKSTANKLVAIRRVTQNNKGKTTPGVDNEVYLTNTSREALVNVPFDYRSFNPQPIKRVFIPKSNNEKRPLGIPTIKDRIMQTIVKNALEPEWEARFEATSFGFRPGKSTMDAITQIRRVIQGKSTSPWILDADISKCFDNISHVPILQRIPVFKTIINRWLKSKVISLGKWMTTIKGTPQGGIISPLLANIALDGMDRLFNGVNRYGDYKMPSIRIGKDKGITVIRYADDFVALAPSKETLESYVIPTIKSFLSQRGLSVNETKTSIKHRSESFNFLGFTTKLFISSNRRSLITKPDKKRVHRYISYIKSIISTKKQISTDDLITQLNPIIRGWTNYYTFVSSKKIFSYVDYRLFKLLWRWCKRRHPKKSSQWVMDKYFRRVGSRKWTFAGEEEILLYHADVPYKRYVQTKIRASPYDSLLKDYWKNKYTATSYL